MSISECIKYWEWSARQFWQYQRRGSWKYAFHGDTLVRYVEMAPADPAFTAGLLEWLKTPESVHGFEDSGKEYAGATVYNRPANLEPEWKAVSAWYEQQEGQVDERTKLKVIRVYQALQKCKEDGEGDGPYEIEKGCAYKVTFTYHWKVESLPEVPQGTSGVSWRLEQISRDDETGLWSCCLVKRERVQQDVAEYLREITEFEARAEEQHLGVRAESVAGTGKAAKVAGGVMVRRQIRKNEDCTSDVTNETVTERPVERAAVTVDRTLRAKTTTVEDRNMPSKLQEDGLKVGERVRNELTPGGLWNRAKTVTEATPPGNIRETCRKSIFEHGHSKTDVVDGEAAPAPDAPEAADGKVTTETVRKMEDGTAEVEREEREELPVREAVVEVRKGLRGVKRTKVHRNQAERAPETGMRIGGVVRNERTEGGLWNQTVEETDASAAGKIHESCQKTALNHVHATTQNVAENPGPADAAEVSNGTIHRKEVRATDEGTYDVTDTTDTAIPVEDTATGGALHRVEERTEHRNKIDITPPAPEVNVEVQASVRTNEHGRKDGVVTKVTHKPRKETASGGAMARTVELEAGINQEEAPVGTPDENVEVDIDVSPNEHGSMTTRKRTVTHHKVTRTATGGTALYDEEETSAINDTETPGETGGNGRTVTCRANPNEHGSASTTKIVRTAKRKHEGKSWTTSDGTWTYNHTIDVYRNWQGVPNVPSGKYQANLSLSINEFGLIDAVVTTTERRKASGSGDQSESISGTEKRYMYYQDKEGKMHRRQVTAHFTCRREAAGQLHTIMLDGAESGLGFHSHDNGSYGIKYTNIQVGAEEDVT